MKTQSTAFAALIAAFTLASAAGAKEVPVKQVPPAVHTAFQKAYPEAKGAKYSEDTKDGKATYEVEFTDKGKKLEATYSADGTPLEVEETVKVGELPEAVIKSVKEAHPHATVKEAEKVLKPDGTVTGYEVEIADGKKRLELELDANGAIQKTEADDE